MDKTRRWIIFIILLAILLRVGLFIIAFIHPDRMLDTDSGSYLSPAKYFLNSGYYSYPGAMRMPLYPVFIAIIFMLFGDHIIYIGLVQILLGICTIYITYKLGLLLEFSRSASTISASILSLSLESLISPLYVLTDTFFTFLLILTTYVFILYIKRNRLLWLVSASLLTGLVTLCRPIALAFAAMVVVVSVEPESTRTISTSLIV